MYTATVENNGSQQYRATSRGYAFVMGQYGANPIETLLAGLCACVAHHVRDRMIERKIAFTTFVIKAVADLNEDKLALARIVVSMEVRGVLSAAECDDLAAQSAFCPLYNTLAKAVAMEITCRGIAS